MITEHFSWDEAFHTSHRGIDNTTDDPAIKSNITATAKKLESVRAMLNVPLTISSWYRSPKLNAAVGGAKNSDHMTGSAVDFIAPRYGSPLDVCRAIIRVNAFIGFKQLILEHTWVHISFDHAIPNSTPKLQVLSLLSGGGYAVGLTNKHGVPYK